MSRRCVLALWIALGCGGRPAAAPAESPGGDLRFEIAAIDPAVDPCTGFYDYACGGWRRSHPIPPDRTRWSRYAELVAQDIDRERSLVEAAARAPATPAEHRVGAYDAACLDQPAIDARGFAPLAGVLAAVNRKDGPAALVDAIAELHRQGIPVLFELYAAADPRDARRAIATLDIGALGLEDPDDYARADAASRAIRDRYRAHVERVLALIGDRDPAGDAARVVALETALARAVPAAADRRDPEHHVHVVRSGEVAARAPALDWPRYLRARAPELASTGGERGSEIGGEIEVEFVPYLEAVGAALAGDPPAVRAYLRYHAARALATVLPSALDREVFDFAQRVVRGARAMRPRWQRCLALVDRDLGEDVGRMFVARWFPEPSRARARAMVERIAAALRRELGAADWLGPATRAAAIRKLDHMRFNIGYPDRWKSYDALVVRADDPVGNTLRAGQLATARELAKLGQPTDRGEFFALPQSLDGSGTNRLVSIQFTAGFLQPPVFDPRVDDPINFGGFGGVIGHEITHHFDDEGRKFDVDGNLAPWWSDADVAAYQARAACFVDEYTQFRIDDGTPLDGRLTLGENLADNGGLRLAWDALQKSAGGPRIDEQREAKGGGAGGNAPRGIDGFTPAQRFFLAWAQIRCENTTPEAARVAVHSDPHAPGRWRVDGVVRNLPEFAAAFSCPSGAPMAPAARCRLW
ncbi:MAG TPA: M13 family metallopeptidase [Kofleriaceae bacterium]|jgi:endothelin-converting enzyme/putative endopeptidase|nr:M13 family metallopeptidase [Kofleriaceae bacterium]